MSKPRSSAPNPYLIVGIEGDYELRGDSPSTDMSVALLTALQQWGIEAPWGPCDAAADLETRGDGVLRAWLHVDLRVDGDSSRADIPAAAAFRSIWDTLEVYGSIALSGVDAIVPLSHAGDVLAHRVETAFVRDPARLTNTTARASTAWCAGKTASG